MKTSVEWLIEQLENSNVISRYAFPEIIEQAKAMEKEQIIEAHLKGYLEEIPNPSASHYYKDMAEQYYNETFKSE
jgi:hypothetical protein